MRPLQHANPEAGGGGHTLARMLAEPAPEPHITGRHPSPLTHTHTHMHMKLPISAGTHNQVQLPLPLPARATLRSVALPGSRHTILGPPAGLLWLGPAAAEGAARAGKGGARAPCS